MTAALLVMDYQTGIVAMIDEADELLARTAEAIATARDHDAVVGFVRVGFTDDDFDEVPAQSQFAGLVSGERRTTMHADHPATALHERLDVRPDDIVVRKTRVGAFSTTDLDEQLRKAGVTTLVLAGISTSGVVLSTVREAADRDYRLVVLADACADRTAEVHDALVSSIFPAQATVITTDRLAEVLAS